MNPDLPTKLAELASVAHLIGVTLNPTFKDGCWELIWCELESNFIDAADDDIDNAASLMLLLKALEAKGWFLSIQPVYEETTECGIIKPSHTPVMFEHRARRLIRPGYWAEAVRCGEGSEALPDSFEGATWTEAVVSATLAVCKALEAKDAS